MSIEAGGRPRVLAGPGLGAARRRFAGVRTTPLVIGAAVGSRLLVLVAGIVSSLTLTPHASGPALRSSERLGAVGHLLAASVDRFDSGFYLAIATQGYARPSAGRAAFFPVYPELIRVLAAFTHSPVLAGALISVVAFVVALTLLARLTELELGRPGAQATTLLLCLAPLSFFFSAVYSESLFLALTVGTFYAARTGRWRVACAVAAAAALTRPTGVLLVAPLLIIWRRDRAPRRELGWLALAPAAILGWTLALAALGYGFGAEFHAEHVIWHRLTVFPLEGLIVSLIALGQGVGHLADGAAIYDPRLVGPFTVPAQDVILGVQLIVCLVLLEVCRRQLRAEYAVYAGLVILMCLASPEVGEPLWCFDRFELTIFPLWMVAGGLLARRRRVLVPVLLLCAAALVFYTMQFASWAFIA